MAAEDLGLMQYTPDMFKRVARGACAVLVTMFMQEAVAYDEVAISTMESKVVDQFCLEREWLRCFYEEPNNCETVVKRFVRPCLTKVLQAQPVQTDPQGARTVATAVLDCFNQKFEEDHRGGKKNSPECKNAPAHLQ